MPAVEEKASTHDSPLLCRQETGAPAFEWVESLGGSKPNELHQCSCLSPLTSLSISYIFSLHMLDFCVWPGVPASGLFFCLVYLVAMMSFCRILSESKLMQRAFRLFAPHNLLRGFLAHKALFTNCPERCKPFHFPSSLQVSLQPCSGTSGIASCRATTSWLLGMASSAEMR